MVLQIDELPIVSHPRYDAWLQQEVYRIAKKVAPIREQAFRFQNALDSGTTIW